MSDCVRVGEDLLGVADIALECPPQRLGMQHHDWVWST